ncbi:MAG: N,N'-diacetylchitobiose phosphorylase [Lachnospiraceae bacterium]|nr:N,N'-diacetylchitobiose phosphorylase [Lachnospiraceae bacterium]
MKFGYFDEVNKEYIIDRPDTPAPWANYLGSPEYGAIISNNAGGYSFVKSGANGRIIRYIFNNFDQPGRYIYIRDNENSDYWSASWQPVGKPLDTYKSECHHGTGYTNIKASYTGIDTEALYYVPLDKTHEVWKLKVTNNSDKDRDLSVFGYCEFTNDNNYEQDQVNLQYTLFITRTYYENNRIKQVINENVKKNAVNDSKAVNRIFAMTGAEVTSYCGDKEEFVGRYHSYANPAAVEAGACNNKLNYNLNACGALSTKITLKPGESKEIAFILGMKEDNEADEIIASYADVAAKTADELEELKAYWHSKLNNLQVKTPSEAFNAMINTWNAYQCFMTFIWSRAASFSYCGLRNGYGYRDTVQDIQGIIHLAPEMALEKIRFMLSAQVDNGGGLPLVKFDHNAGHEDTPDDESYVRATGHPAYRADDALWLFPTIYKYIAETGNVDFIDEVIVFANGGEGTVYEHLKRAIDFSMNRLGNHNMPAGLHADWNDCLRLGKKGESSFVAMQLYYAMTVLKGFAEIKKDEEYIKYLDDIQTALGNIIQDKCWEEDRFVRGYTEDGQIIGSKHDKEATMWLNPQSWSVISGLASPEQAEKALESVHRELNTPYGVKLMNPPYVEHAFDGALMLLFNPGTKENSGIFSQPQGWIILAESLMGHGNRAFEYFMESSPAAMNDKAEIRKLEPYCHGQFTESDDSPYAGRSHVHWLTGTASTVMVGCVEGILGIRPDYYGIKIAPSIPSDWKNFEIYKNYRGKKLNIKVNNPDSRESGVKEVTVNGKLMASDYIPFDELSEENDIVISI